MLYYGNLYNPHNNTQKEIFLYPVYKTENGGLKRLNNCQRSEEH